MLTDSTNGEDYTMTDTEIELREIKCTMRRMQRDIDELAMHIAEQEKNCKEHYQRTHSDISCMNLAPSTQAYNCEYDRE